MNNVKITNQDMIKYRDKIEYWKKLRTTLIKHKRTVSEAQIKTFTDVDGDILDLSLTDEQICLKAKTVYEFTPSFSNEDLITLKDEINLIKNNHKGEFNSDKDLVIALKIYKNNIKKNLFEENIIDKWDINYADFNKEIYKEAKEKGWFVYE